MTGIIGDDVMIEAIRGHIERMAVDADGIMSVMTAMSVSPDAIGNAITVLAEARDDGTDPTFNLRCYQAAVLEGVIIGIRAARIADNKEENE